MSLTIARLHVRNADVENSASTGEVIDDMFDAFFDDAVDYAQAEYDDDGLIDYDEYD